MTDTSSDILGDWTMRRGDRLPLIALRLEDDEGRPLDVSAARVWLMVRCEDGRSPVYLPSDMDPLPLVDGWVEAEMNVYDSPGGIVTYDWGDLGSTGLAVGVDQMMVRVDYLNGDHITVPTARDARLVVRSPILPIADPTKP